MTFEAHPARRTAVAVAAALTLGLTACGGNPSGALGPATSPISSAVPTVTPSPEETPVPSTTHPPNAQSLVLSAVGLTTAAAGSSPRTLVSTDVDAAVAELTSLFGPPVETASNGEAHCTTAGTTYDWSGALSLFASPSSSGSFETRLLKRSFTRLDGSTITLSGPQNVRVGDDISGLIAQTPLEHRESSELDGTTSTTLLLGPVEKGNTASQGTSGVAAFTSGPVVTAIGWPVAVHSDADC